MKKLKIFLAAVLGMVVVGYLLLFITVRILFPSERLKEIIVPKISAAVGREVSIEDVGLSVFPGLSLNVTGLTVANATGFRDEPLLKLRALSLNVKLLPLLSKHVEVESIVLKNPQVLIERNKAGKFNFELPEAAKEAAAPPTEELESSPVSLLVNSARIQDGQLLFVDHQNNKRVAVDKIDQRISIALDKELRNIRATGQIEIKGLSFKDLKQRESAISFPATKVKYDFSIDSQDKLVRIEQLVLAVASTQLNFAGVLKNYDTTPAVDLTLKTNEIEFRNLLDLIPREQFPALARLQGDGKINLKMAVRGAIAEDKTPAVQGTLAFNKLTLGYSGLPDKLSNLNGSVDFTDKNLNLKNVSASLGSNRAALSGSIVDFGHPKIDLKLDADLDLGSMKRYLQSPEIKSKIPPDQLPRLAKLNGTGQVHVKMGARGAVVQGKVPHVDGLLAFEELSLSSTELPNKISHLSGRIQFTENSVSLRNITAQLGKDPFALSGSVSDFEHPRYDLKLKTDLNLGAVKDYVELPAGMAVSGRLRADLTARGNVAQPKSTSLNGQISLTRGKFTSPDLAVPVRDINGKMSLSGRRVKIANLTLRAGKSSLALSGEILDPVGKRRGTLRLTSSLLDLDEIFPETESEEAGTSRGEPIKLPFETLDGKVRITKLITNNIVLNHATADVIIRNNVLSIKNFRSGLYSGKLAGSAKADFNDPSGLAYAIDMRCDSLDVNDFASNAIPLKDALFGKMQLKLNARGTGTSVEDIKKNLVAEGTSVVFNGKITNLPMLHSLASFLNLPTFENMKFKTVSNRFKLRNETISFDKFELKAFDNDMSLDGKIGLDGSLDFAVSMLLSEELTRRFRDRAVQVPQFLLVDSNRLPLDFIVKGTKDKPEIVWDMKKALSRTTESTIQKGLGKIFGGLRKNTGEDDSKKSTSTQAALKTTDTGTKKDSVSTSKRKTEADPLKNVLEGLFGKKKKKKNNLF
ncbi:MAG: AsmA-like C-terminal region-containing protein [bacterium]